MLLLLGRHNLSVATRRIFAHLGIAEASFRCLFVHYLRKDGEADQWLTVSTTPVGDEAPPMVAITGQSPFASVLGTWIANW